MAFNVTDAMVETAAAAEDACIAQMSRDEKASSRKWFRQRRRLRAALQAVFDRYSVPVPGIDDLSYVPVEPVDEVAEPAGRARQRFDAVNTEGRRPIIIHDHAVKTLRVSASDGERDYAVVVEWDGGQLDPGPIVIEDLFSLRLMMESADTEPTEEGEPAEREQAATLGGGCRCNVIGNMPVFVIKAKDILAGEAISAYRELCLCEGLHEQAAQVRLALDEIIEWQRHHEDLLEVPDHKHVPARGKGE